MGVVFTHGTGLDVHTKTVMACRLPPDPPEPQADGIMERREFGMMTRDLLALSDWLAEAGITHVAMERTGEYWQPVYPLLAGDCSVFPMNAAHVKQVSGRKTDQADARWLAKLMRHDGGTPDRRQWVRLRITKIDEYQFLTCLKHGLWGSKSARFTTWEIGDRLAFIVEKSLAGLGEVAGPPFESHEKVWDNGLFPHRLPRQFTQVLRPQDRPPILGKGRDALTEEWGPRYGGDILPQKVLESPNADIVIRAITSKPDALADYQHDLAERFDAARRTREQAAQRRSRRARPPTCRLPRRRLNYPMSPPSPREMPRHTPRRKVS